MYDRQITKMEELELRNRAKALSAQEMQIVIEEFPTALLIKEIQIRNHILEEKIKQVSAYINGHSGR